RDDADPGAGQDADGVGVSFAAGDGVCVDLGGPGAGVSGVVCEVDDCVAELLVGGPSESDRVGFAGCAGDRCDAGQGGQGFLVGEPGADVADLGQQQGCADAVAGLGQAGEDVGVGGGAAAVDGGGLSRPL